MIFQMSFSAGILILFIMMVRSVMRFWLPRKIFPVLWYIALYRLLFPPFISSRFSIYFWFPLLWRRLTNVVSSALSDRFLESGAVNAPIAESALSVAFPMRTGINIPVAKTLWIIGMCMCAFYFLLSHFVCLTRYKMSLPVENAWIKKWQAEHSLWRKVEIRQSDQIGCALTYGLFRPVVLLPKTMDRVDETQLRCILTHEYVHIRQGDIALKWIMAAAVCVHWFNPLVWIMYRLAERDMELSCDETVVQMLGEDIRYVYALTLIKWEEKRHMTVPFADFLSKMPMEERMVFLMKNRKMSHTGVLAAGVVMISAVVFFSTAPVSRAFDGVGTVGSSVDLVRSEKIVDLTDLAAPKHYIKNGQMVVYRNEGHAWTLKKDDGLRIDVETEYVLKDGQTAEIGYVADGVYVSLFRGKIPQRETIEFTAPEEGDYMFYLIGASSDTINVQSLTIL